jgi:hypothetical protein
VTLSNTLIEFGLKLLRTTSLQSLSTMGIPLLPFMEFLVYSTKQAENPGEIGGQISEME